MVSFGSGRPGRFTQTPLFNLMQDAGQSTWPLTHPGARQATVPSPLHAKLTFSLGPGPASTGGGAEAEDCFVESDTCFPQLTNSSTPRKQASTGQNAKRLGS